MLRANRDNYNTAQDAQHETLGDPVRPSYTASRRCPCPMEELGLKSGKQASLDIAGLTGQYQAVVRSGQAKGLKFTDFIQDEIDAGRLSPGDDVYTGCCQSIRQTVRASKC